MNDRHSSDGSLLIPATKIRTFFKGMFMSSICLFVKKRVCSVPAGKKTRVLKVIGEEISECVGEEEGKDGG